MIEDWPFKKERHVMIEGKKLALAGVRERFNGGVKGFGNRFYDGLGDVLAFDISPRRALSVGLVGLAIGGGVGNSGCSDYGNAVARSVGEYALMEGVAGAVRNEVEGPRGTVVNVGGGNNSTASERIFYRVFLRKYEDFDNDFDVEKFSPLMKHNSTLNLNGYTGVYVYVVPRASGVVYSVFNLDNNKFLGRLTSDNGLLVDRKNGEHILIEIKVPDSNRPLGTEFRMINN